jgi:hypothetical protein
VLQTLRRTFVAALEDVLAAPADAPTTPGARMTVREKILGALAVLVLARMTVRVKMLVPMPMPRGVSSAA